MSAQTPTLKHRIEHCRLLRADQRALLLAALPSLNSQQAGRLSLILDQEQPILEQAMRTTLAAASERNDTAFFASLDRLLADASTALRKAEEPFDRSDEEQSLEHFFDDAA